MAVPIPAHASGLSDWLVALLKDPVLGVGSHSRERLDLVTCRIGKATKGSGERARGGGRDRREKKRRRERRRREKECKREKIRGRGRGGDGMTRKSV